MSDLQTDWLKCFIAAVDAGSLSGAAPQVHRSQSAVSMQIKKLEAAVGCQLLVRGPRHLALTHEGQVLLGYARRMLDLHGEAQAALQGESVTGLVRLGVPDDYASKYLTPVLKRFAPRHGGIEIQLDCEQSTSLIPRVAGPCPARHAAVPRTDGLGRLAAVRHLEPQPAAHRRV
jgi:DNA-binding transcriptional LysR family regulator